MPSVPNWCITHACAGGGGQCGSSVQPQRLHGGLRDSSRLFSLCLQPPGHVLLPQGLPQQLYRAVPSEQLLPLFFNNLPVCTFTWLPNDCKRLQAGRLLLCAKAAVAVLAPDLPTYLTTLCTAA